MDKDKHQYEDIIDLPHHQSNTRPRMSLYDRAAQFSPFAALTGHDEAVKETARLTDEKMELPEETKHALSAKLHFLKKLIKTQPMISITYFIADERKSGGSYVTETGVVKKIDEYLNIIIMENQTRIPIEHVTEIHGEVFAMLGQEMD